MAERIDWEAGVVATARRGLPVKLVWRRVEVQLEAWLDWLRSEVYARRGWSFGDVQRTPPRQTKARAVGGDLAAPLPGYRGYASRDVDVEAAEWDASARIREINVTFRNLPHPVDLRAPAGAGSGGGGPDEPVIGWTHRFSVVLPPSYPSDLRMRFYNLSETVHPRMLPPDREAPACIFPQADLDHALRELLWNLLLHPDVVRPPTDHNHEDPGYRPRLMKWYLTYGPTRLHTELTAAWQARHDALNSAPPSGAGPAS